VDRASSHVSGARQRSDQIGDRDRVPVGLGLAAVEAGLGPLADDGRGRHLSAGVTEDAVVEHDRGNAFTSSRGVEDLRQALAGDVTVALQGEDGRVGMHPLDPGGYRWSAAVEALQEVDVGQLHDVGVAAVADDPDGFVLQVQLRNGFEQEPPRHGVPAPRAEVVLAGQLKRSQGRSDLTVGRQKGLRIVHTVTSLIT